MSDALLYTPSGCVLYLDLRKSVGDKLLDYSGHGNAGTIYGARLEYRHPLWGLSFDGVDDYVEVPHSDVLSLTRFTIEVVLHVNEVKRMGVVRKGYGGRQNYLLRLLEDGRILFYLETDVDSYYLYSVDKYGVKQFHVIHYVFDGDYSSGYLDARYQGRLKVDGNVKTNPDPLTIAVERPTATGYMNYLDGVVALVRIYNRALTAEEVKRCYEDIKLRLLRRMQPVSVSMIR